MILLSMLTTDQLLSLKQAVAQIIDSRGNIFIDSTILIYKKKSLNQVSLSKLD